MMRWIETYGGNLICRETTLLDSWKGNQASSVGGDETDYGRAGKISNHSSVISVADGAALVISSGPLEASVWKGSLGLVHIVNVEYSKPNMNDGALLTLIPRDFFDDAFTTLFEVSAGKSILFDSFDAGSERLHVEITFSIEPGTYKIRSKIFSPPEDASYMLYRFQQN